MVTQDTPKANAPRRLSRGATPDSRSPWAACLASVALVVLASCGGSTSTAASGNPGATEDFVVVSGSIDPILTPIYVGIHEGYFKSQGLNVSVKNVGGNSIASLASGVGDLAVSGAGPAYQSVKSGLNTSVVYKWNGGGAGAFVASIPSVNSVADCKKMATFSAGSTVYAYSVLFRKLFNANYQILQFGSANLIPAAVQSGSADCEDASYGVVSQLVTNGTLHLIVDPRQPSTLPPNSVIPKIAEGAIWGVKAHLQERRSAVTKFLRAVDQAFNRVNQLSAAQLAAMLRTFPDWKAFDENLLAQQITTAGAFEFPNEKHGQLLGADWSENVGFWQAGGFTFMDPTSSDWTYENRVDMSYLNAALGKTS